MKPQYKYLGDLGDLGVVPQIKGEREETRRAGMAQRQVMREGDKRGALPRPEFVLTLKPLPGVDGVQALRAALKRLLRNHGLRCIRATVTDTTTSAGDTPEKEISNGTHSIRSKT